VSQLIIDGPNHLRCHLLHRFGNLWTEQERHWKPAEIESAGFHLGNAFGTDWGTFLIGVERFLEDTPVDHIWFADEVVAYIKSPD
jgi:hypothetical protein